MYIQTLHGYNYVYHMENTIIRCSNNLAYHVRILLANCAYPDNLMP